MAIDWTRLMDAVTGSFDLSALPPASFSWDFAISEGGCPPLQWARRLATGVGTALAPQSRLINLKSFWSTSFQKALFAREVARLLGADRELAFKGALLQDYLLPILTEELYEQYLEFIKRRDRAELEISRFEEQTFGWNHALAGACLARRCSLPDELGACILFHHAGVDILSDPDLGHSPAAAGAISALLPEQLRQCVRGLEHLRGLEASWPAFRLLEIAEHVDAEFENAGIGVRTEFPLAWVCRAKG